MNEFRILKQVIETRRSTKPALMNGKKIDDSLIWQLLELANWAPTHAHTEPARFIVYAGEAKKQFCFDHAELYKANTTAEKFTTAAYEKQLHMGDTLSHIIAVIMKRGDNPKIPAIEEIASVAASVQNMLLGAASLGIAALWSTGGMTHHPAMKKYFGLSEHDVVMGLLYLGYTDEEPSKEGKRITAIADKVNWK